MARWASIDAQSGANPGLPDAAVQRLVPVNVASASVRKRRSRRRCSKSAMLVQDAGSKLASRRCVDPRSVPWIQGRGLSCALWLRGQPTARAPPAGHCGHQSLSWRLPATFQLQNFEVELESGRAPAEAAPDLTTRILTRLPVPRQLFVETSRAWLSASGLAPTAASQFAPVAGRLAASSQVGDSELEMRGL